MTGYQWRVSPKLPMLKGAAALVFMALAIILTGDATRIVVAGAAALLLGGMALRDLLVPVRLAADEHGLTVVHGFAGRRQLAWAQVDRIRLDVRRRFGIRSELVEIDAGERLYLYSASELGAPCDEVVSTLNEIRKGCRIETP